MPHFLLLENGHESDALAVSPAAEALGWALLHFVWRGALYEEMGDFLVSYPNSLYRGSILELRFALLVGAEATCPLPN
jgi:hypothetical protein